MTPTDTQALWLVIGLAGLGTFLIRVSFFELFGQVGEPSARLSRALEMVPAAVLAALVLPRLVYLDGTFALPPGNAEFVAGTVAAVAAWYTESIPITLAVGMGTLWTLLYLA